MDFGLAKLVDREPIKLHKATDTGHDFAVGTPGYISPEQVRGDEMDHRSDLYSVGVILFEMLSGRLPFTGDETMDVLLAHATEQPPSFAEVGATAWVTPAIEAVVQRCLAKSPADRPASARDLAEMFEAALADDGSSREAPEPVVSTASPNGSESQATPARAPTPLDPTAVVHEMEAWMPDTIAAFKLKGFVHDVGGELVESVPGRIRVRLGGPGSAYEMSKGPLGWLGLRRKQSLIDVELRLERNNPTQASQLHITVLMRSLEQGVTLTPAWRERCARIFCDLRAYLAGASVTG
jgi:serine/threonine-protein kinase